MRLNFRLYIGLILLPILIFPVITSINEISDSDDEPIVLIDNSHGQFINSSLLTKAIDYLEQHNFQVIVTNDTDSLNTNILAGVDLLIIPNPSADAKFEDIEKVAIGNWLETGNRGLIFLTNPHFQDNTSLSGNPSEFNKLLTSGYLRQTGMSYEYTQGTVNGIQLNKFTTSSSDPSYLTLTSDNMKNASNLGLLEDSFQVITQASSVKISANLPIFLSAGYDAYGIDSNGYSVLQNNDPVIIAGGDLSGINNSRLILGASTLMFSDLINPLEDKAWFDLANNTALFSLMIKWTLNIEAETTSEVNETTDWTFIIFGVLLFGVLFVLVGIIVYKTGKEIGLFEASFEEIRASSKKPTVDADTDTQKQETLTRSQKKLRQRQQKQSKRKK
ncbi:MAG: hypothetical protein ACXAC7_16915 [Candidatus Hodarchaeales archaeon]